VRRVRERSLWAGRASVRPPECAPAVPSPAQARRRIGAFQHAGQGLATVIEYPDPSASPGSRRLGSRVGGWRGRSHGRVGASIRRRIPRPYRRDRDRTKEGESRVEENEAKARLAVTPTAGRDHGVHAAGSTAPPCASPSRITSSTPRLTNPFRLALISIRTEKSFDQSTVGPIRRDAQAAKRLQVGVRVGRIPPPQDSCPPRRSEASL